MDLSFLHPYLGEIIVFLDPQIMGSAEIMRDLIVLFEELRLLIEKIYELMISLGIYE